MDRTESQSLPQYTIALWAAGVISFPPTPHYHEISDSLPTIRELKQHEPQIARSIQQALKQRPYLRTLEEQTIRDPFKK